MQLGEEINLDSTVAIRKSTMKDPINNVFTSQEEPLYQSQGALRDNMRAQNPGRTSVTLSQIFSHPLEQMVCDYTDG